MPPTSSPINLVPSNHTRNVFLNGKVVVVCNGPLCSIPPRNLPRRATCSHQYCKKCCLKYQSMVNLPCKEAEHQPVAATPSSAVSDDATSPIAVPASSQPAKPGKSLSRPLHMAHFEARQHAIADWNAVSSHRTSQQAAEVSVDQAVTLVFWQNATKDPFTVTVVCPKFPVFHLTDCSLRVQKRLGVAEDSEGDGWVETFLVETASWGHHEAATPRRVDDGLRLLYRVPDLESGVNMDIEVTNAMSFVAGLPPAASKHAAWPFMYVIDMAEGFAKMPKMSGNLEEKFLGAFRCKMNKATYNKHARVWRAGVAARLADGFVAKGRSDSGGTWKEFTEKVLERFGGDTPGMREACDGQAIEDGPIQSVTVKKEITEPEIGRKVLRKEKVVFEVFDSDGEEVTRPPRGLVLSTVIP
ncbi:hypothetical protein BDN72DRAFT_781634 [Pluteus cervinus]|uniref:Uncharacterized protein n=1 Tax=Pluteus cervinus TaxID=181527 RepID=A0ACD2ZZC1_9AGAR|nr:hypothetical protein BDN72DRAFT_781634 [Pluteus cervinus]